VSAEILEPLSSNLSRVSPLSSWLIFRRNSNKGDNRRTKGPRKPSKHGLPGPPGPPGPQGPPGPPATLLPQQQELLQELQLKLRGAVCFQCDGPPRVSASFLSRLLQVVIIPRRSLLELQPFSQPSDSEQSLQRGRSFNSSSGRFTAAVSGFYQLTASLLIETGDRVQLRLRDSVRAAICIESLCQSHL
uniref:C1q domain-containing protein n=2 Tax=Cyclopterus lumpus TaxID=8103 RepID=A0A8C2YXW6_CYCLU